MKVAFDKYLVTFLKHVSHLIIVPINCLYFKYRRISLSLKYKTFLVSLKVNSRISVVKTVSLSWYLPYT